MNFFHDEPDKENVISTCPDSGDGASPSRRDVLASRRRKGQIGYRKAH